LKTFNFSCCWYLVCNPRRPNFGGTLPILRALCPACIHAVHKFVPLFDKHKKHNKQRILIMLLCIFQIKITTIKTPHRYS
jgi:hypothetical protein